MSTKKDIKKTETNSAPEDVSRRRILKGLASVPAIATLGATGGVAAQSMAACSGKAAPLPTTAAQITDANEPGVTYNCQDPNASGTLGGTVSIDDPLPGGGALPEPPRLYDNLGNAAVAESSATAAGTNSHCVVYLNPTDNSLTFNANAAGVDPVTTSCMASIGGIVQ